MHQGNAVVRRLRERDVTESAMIKPQLGTWKGAYAGSKGPSEACER